LTYDFSIIVPARDEEQNLPHLFKNILEKRTAFSWNCELIIVDDHSKDGTWQIIADIASKYNWVIGIRLLGKNKGMGAALIEGTKKARSKVIVWLMADLSDELDIVNDLTGAVNSGFDLVIASRGLSLREHGLKGVLSKTYSAACRLFFGVKARDVTNAFRAFDKRVLEKFGLECQNFAISPELTLKAHLSGFKIGEINTRYKKRMAGKSKFKILFMAWPYGIVFFKLFIAKIAKTVNLKGV